MPEMHVSYESIYRHIYEHPQGRVNKKLIRLLARGRTRRKRRVKRKGRSEPFRGGMSIDLRPAEILNRLTSGHWEGDLVVGSGQKSCIATLVERKTRYVLIVKPASKKSADVCAAMIKALLSLPEMFRKTMTYDNGSEMAEHKSITDATGVDVYFAHPYSSWERGTNENTNGLIRRFYPKGTDFRAVAEKDLLAVQNRLNRRPRKILGFHTPEEMMEFEKLIHLGNDYNDTVLEMGNKPARELFSFLMPMIR